MRLLRDIPSAILILTCLGFPIRGAEVSSNVADGLCLYIPFEGSTAPSFCLGSADVTLGAGSIGEGRVGQGACIVGTAAVSLPATGNFHRPRGTIAFWHRPLWNPAEASDANRMLLKQSNFQLTWSCSRQVLFFMTGRTQFGKGYKWDYSVASKEPLSWQGEQWHHVAIAWDSATGEKELFLDGRLAREGKTEWIRSEDVRLGEDISLGDATAEGSYDEWAIWDRILSPERVAFLAGQPEDAAKALGATKPAEAATAAPVRFELARLTPCETIVDPGEVFHLPTTAHNRTAGPVDLTMHLTLVDVFGNVQDPRNEQITLGPSEKKPLTFELRADRFGVYKLRAEMEWKGRTFRSDLGGFAVWPKGKLKPSRDSFFGHHVNSWSGGAFVKQAARLGLSWQRDHDMLQTTWWVRVQPEAGAPQWTCDFQLDYYKAAGMFVSGELFSTPWWAADPPQPRPKDLSGYPKSWKPNLQAFEDYVRMTVSRYKDTIHVWEVWNEPEVSIFWKGTAEEFGRLAEVACRAAKAADPACIVLVAGFTGVSGREWYEAAAQAGAFRYADGISYHGYAHEPGEMRRKFEFFRDLAAQYAPEGRRMQLWDSEWGVQDTTFYVDADFPDLPPKQFLPLPSFLEGAASVVKTDCTAMALGVTRSFYYLQNDVKGQAAYHNRSTLEITRAPRPKLIARVALDCLVRGAKAHALIEKGVWSAVVFAKNDGTSMAALWTLEKGKAMLPVSTGEGVDRFDLFANSLGPLHDDAIELSDVPVYIVARIPADRLAAMLRDASVTMLQDQRPENPQ